MGRTRVKNVSGAARTPKSNLKRGIKPRTGQPKNQPKNQKTPAKARPKVQVTTSVRRGEVIRAQRMLASDVTMRATQHVINNPVNKSIFNGNKGKQISPITLKKTRPHPKAVRIIPLGGLGEAGIGKNMTVIEYGNELVVIDMGTIFPDVNDYPGINYMVADISYLEKNRHKIKAFLFTHAHLDHIGATKLILPKFPNVPVYGTAFTVGMIQRQISELPQEYNITYQTIDPFTKHQVKISEHFSIEFVHVLHSIPGAVAIVIRTPNGVIVHSGDWRFEQQPINKPFDMPRLLEIAQKEGIDLLLNESTNIDSPGTHPITEVEVGDNIGEVMDQFPNSRIIVSCFSSQIYRIGQILKQAHAHGRKVAFSGFSMISTAEIALRTQELKVPKDTVMKIEDIVKLPDSQVTIICTGSQGELNAVLNRMVSGAHKYIKIKGTDVILFSSNPIPGNEPQIVNTIDGLLREGASVIQNNRSHLTGIGLIHLSGQAYYDDHVIYVKSLHPRNYMPIHGQFFMLEHNAEMAHNVAGIPKENILVCDNGDIVELLPDKTIRKNGRVHVGSIMFDNSDNEVNDAVVKDRLHISSQGIVVLVMLVNKKTGRLAKTPDIISRAFIYLKDNEELMSRIRHYLKIKIEKDGRSADDLKELKEEIKDDVSQILYDETGHTPIIIPVINLF